jgi:hypothetical protein
MKYQWCKVGKSVFLGVVLLTLVACNGNGKASDSDSSFCTDSGRGGVETIEVGSPRPIRRIRIDLQKRGSDYGFSLYEVKVYGPDGEIDLREIGGQASASHPWQNDEWCPDCAPYKAIDGDMGTRWAGPWEDDQWFDITLPEAQTVSRIQLEWEAAYARKYCVILE